LNEAFPSITPEKLPEKTVYSIQVLRGLAAVLVMFFHYSHYLKSVVPGADIGYQMFAGGYVGVDIFFIVSGFIIVYSTVRKENSDPVDFAIRRFFRVVPMAQIATLVYFSIVAATPSLKLLLQSLFFLPSADTNPPTFGYPVVAQEWTLSYELIFYGVFAVVLVFTHSWRVIVAALSIVTFVVGFQLILGGPLSLRPNAVYLPPAYHGLVPPEILGVLGNPIMLEFVAGMFLAVAYRRLEEWLRSEKRCWVERLAGFSLIGMFGYSYVSRLNPGNGLLDKGASAVCLVTGALLLETSFRRPSESAPVGGCLAFPLWLGSISYPLYLVHVGIAERMLRFLCSILLGIKVDGIAGFVALVATSLILASGAHVFLERRFIRFGKLLISYKNKVVPIAVVL
jgi:exopolysaccharide production protein ExoZ